jgi:hypothetical protein
MTIRFSGAGRLSSSGAPESEQFGFQVRGAFVEEPVVGPDGATVSQHGR